MIFLLRIEDYELLLILMEQEIKFPSLEIHNENIHIPYRQLPAFESKMVDIYCQDFNHRD